MNRIFVEKKPEFNGEARHLLSDLRESLGLPGLEAVRIVQRYDVDGLSDPEFDQAVRQILSEPQVDLTSTTLSIGENESAFAVEYLPGQFDQRADSAAQCVQILTGKERPLVVSAKVILLAGNLRADDLARIKGYVINAVDSHEVPVAAVCDRRSQAAPADVAILEGFTTRDPAAVRAEFGLAMSAEDVAFCQTYFRDEEKRDPSITEIRMLDTYWSDHCRHTTFLTKIDEVTFAEGTAPVERAWQTYLATREQLGRQDKPVTLMDIALIGMRELRASGELDNLEVSEEVNAASIVVQVPISKTSSIYHPPSTISEEWLVMFKNETHNHPTEIEPFGGAATCLGGCIRDPLSGRSYVYQAMRVTGAGNPLTPFSDTLPGKLPQKKICQVAAAGYSSYGNQIGLATGQVAEIYHPGYVAKRMEIGAVVSAAPRSQVFRGSPSPGDVILLIGGRTGRDGVGGATGSSKEHTDTALENSAEVQKGDAPTERKIQRLFRNPELTKKIKICNDFGAGGVSVAIGEIAPSLDIDLDAVPKKYDGLDGTELAISESQERMAVCIDPADAAYFIAESDKENLECVHVANVTDSGRLRMKWRGKTIVDLSRAFLDTNGVQQTAKIHVRPIPPLGGGGLTAVLHSNHEQEAHLLERSTSQEFRESLGSRGQAVADVLRRVHEASARSGLGQPTERAKRLELERALRTVEERELRRLSDAFLDAREFDIRWREQGSVEGAEQRVHVVEGADRILKSNNGSYHGHWSQYFERLAFHLLLFPETAYAFEGLINDGLSLAFVVSQQAYRAARDASGKVSGATRSQVENEMAARFGAFRFRNDDYYLPSLDLFIEDLHDENVLIGTDGETLIFIDPVLFRRPADVAAPACPSSFFQSTIDNPQSAIALLSDLNHCSQKGLGHRFDGSVGAGTVLWPFGGKHQLTPPDAMVAKLPLLEGDTDVCTYMSWGFNPRISSWSPFHGAAYAVTESVCKAVAAGARLSDIRLTLQEYFPKLGNDPARWGLPFAALLGAFHVQHELRLAAIGGKDSMSGSFNELDVPPTLVSFALAPGLASLALSPEFKKAGSKVSLVTVPRDADQLPDFAKLKDLAAALHDLNAAGHLLSMKALGSGGLLHALATSAFGNAIGFVEHKRGAGGSPAAEWSTERYFSFLLEHESDLPAALGATLIGHTTAEPVLTFASETHALADLQAAWEGTLEPVYPTKGGMVDGRSQMVDLEMPRAELGTSTILHPPSAISGAERSSSTIHHPPSTISRPKVLIPAFPGTNSEYDSAKAFREAGADAEILVFRNLTSRHIEESLEAFARQIRRSQILMFPGGFSAGDEPDGSAKFIATIIRNPRVSDAIMDLLKNRDGLVLGICNGFQALIKTGLVPYGEILEDQEGHGRPAREHTPTLVHNDIGRHISCYATTKVVSTTSPWLALCQPGDLHAIPLSHGEGKFHASDEVIADLARNGQIATQYVDEKGTPSMDIAINPNGSRFAIEGITSPCGRVFGKMGHTERSGTRVAKNIPGEKHQPIFAAGVKWFS